MKFIEVSTESIEPVENTTVYTKRMYISVTNNEKGKSGRFRVEGDWEELKLLKTLINKLIIHQKEMPQ